MIRSKWLALSIIASTGLLIVASLIWPMSQLRDESIDRAIENDFYSISTSVSSYNNDRSRLPNDLSDLDLSNEIKQRGYKYDYEFDKTNSRTYQLCAKFKTDTTKVNDSNTIYSSSYSSSDYYNARTHSSGFDCIEYNSYGYFNEQPIDNTPDFQYGL